MLKSADRILASSYRPAKETVITVTQHNNPTAERPTTDDAVTDDVTNDVTDAKAPKSSGSSQQFTSVSGSSSVCQSPGVSKAPLPAVTEPEVLTLPCLEHLPSYMSQRVCGRIRDENEALNLFQNEDKVIRVYHIAHLMGKVKIPYRLYAVCECDNIWKSM